MLTWSKRIWFMIPCFIYLVFLAYKEFCTGTILVLLGACMNFSVCALNRGRMPVPRYMLPTWKHSSMHDETKLWFFGDIVELGIYKRILYISFGDIIMFTGVIFWSLSK